MLPILSSQKDVRTFSSFNYTAAVLMKMKWTPARWQTSALSAEGLNQWVGHLKSNRVGTGWLFFLFFCSLTQAMSSCLSEGSKKGAAIPIISQQKSKFADVDMQISIGWYFISQRILSKETKMQKVTNETLLLSVLISQAICSGKGGYAFDHAVYKLKCTIYSWVLGYVCFLECRSVGPEHWCFFFFLHSSQLHQTSHHLTPQT